MQSSKERKPHPTGSCEGFACIRDDPGFRRGRTYDQGTLWRRLRSIHPYDVMGTYKPPRHFVALALGATLALLAPDYSRAADPQPGSRPRVGLVLAGGGAKGGAHVGVLKVLEELHVPIDCIAG